MTRDEARKAFAEAGLSYCILSDGTLQDLRRRIDLRMKETRYMKGTYRMRRACRIEQSDQGIHASLRCESHHFEDREAITFNPDGFIGFAGWADERNVQPILSAFKDWVSAHAPAVVTQVEPASPGF